MEPTDTNPTINEIEQRELERLKIERAAKRSIEQSQRWRDPEFRQKTLAAMKEARGNARWRAKMRKEKFGSARQRFAKTGVMPHWTPKRVRATEPNGKSFTYDSIRQCGEHYGIKESNMRAIIKFGRAWNGITFLVEQ